MKQAHRVYKKHKFVQQHQSPFFKSGVRRTDIEDGTCRQPQPGPGSYDIVLPLVKPKYEAIFKNNRSIIIKVNESQGPAFFTKQARFKQFSTIQPRKHQLYYQLRDFDSQPTVKIKNSGRYNFSLSRKRTVENISTSMIMTNNISNRNEAQNNKEKGISWSKYRQQRQIWNKNANNPGPGSYDSIEKKKKYRIQPTNSWQFRSQTKRYKQPHLPVNMPELLQKKINSIHSRIILIQSVAK